MTSSDLLDTALALQLVEATDLLLAKCDALVARCATSGCSTPAPSRSAARTASTPSRPPSATGWPTWPSPWPAPATGCCGPARRSPSPRSAARSGPTPTSTRRWSRCSPSGSASPPPPPPPRS
jgi:hypothetical protein